MGAPTEPRTAETRAAVPPPPLFTKREKYAIAALTAAFVLVSAVVHFVIGSIGGTLFPQVRQEAAAPPQVVGLYHLETPTPPPIPVPTPTPHTTSTRQPSSHTTSAPAIPKRAHPRSQSTDKPIVAASAPPQIVGPPGTPASSPEPSSLPTASPSVSTTPIIAVDAYFVNKVAPDYPDLAQQEHIEGQVTVDVTIGPDGRVEGVQLVKSSGSKLLDDAALDAARASTFRPPLVNGIPTSRDYLIIYTFSLED
jgi:periplasmic protein TonB